MPNSEDDSVSQSFFRDSEVSADLKSLLENFNPSRGSQVEPDSHEGAEVGKRGDGDVSKAADDALKYMNERRAAEIARLKMDNEQREKFFKFVLLITGIPVLVAAGALVRVVWDGDVGDSVLIGFFASVVVEVIGLSIIVANYLFPKTGSVPPGVEKALEE